VLTLTVASVTGYFAAATAHEVAGSTVSWSNAAVVSVMLCFGGWFATTRAALERAIFEDLRNSETRLQVMVEQMPAVLWTTDCDLRYTLSLGAGLAALGLEPNQAVGSTLFEYFQTDDAAFPPIAAHQRALRGEPVSYAAEWMGTAFHCHVEPLRDSRGAIIGAIGTAQDISDLQRSAQALQESEERYRRLVEASPEPIGVHRDGKIVYANAAAARLFGAAAARDLIGKPVLDLVHPDDREDIVERIRAMQQEGTPAELAEERLLRLDGQPVDVEVLTIPITYEGSPAALAVVRDVTGRKRAELLQAGQRQALEMVARGTPLEEVLDSLVRMIEEQSPGLSCSICMLSPDGSRLIPAAAPNVPAEFALALAEGVPVGPRSGSCGTAAHLRAAVVSGDIATDPLWVDYREAALRSHIEACWSLPILSGAGDVLGTFAMYYSTPRIPSAAEQRLVEIAAHIAGLAIERARAEETISHLAYHDHLTGLPNRALFHDRLTVALAQARRQKRTAAVLFLDLDEFKTVNDTAGHVLGDGLLQKVAERLTGVIREGDTAARMGGDEFAVLVPEVSSVDEVAQVAERVLEAFRRPWVLGGQEFHVTTSVGIAMYPTDSGDAESLLRNADDAMYEAKDQGKNRYNLYTAALSVRIAERLALESSLRRGLERREFVVY
jgi:diguanylate cyclase (GGDEF)-like protein/PAS domain S-box-containing protein